MLILRRRPQEAIVVDGGLAITVVEILEHRAWLRFGAPAIPVAPVIASFAVGPGAACIGIRTPATIAREPGIVRVTLDPSAGADAVLLVNVAPGERVELPGVHLELRAIDEGRPVLEVLVDDAPSSIGVTVCSVSGTEAKIGIDAPADVRVYREELWTAIRDANASAATWSTGELEGLGGARVAPSEAARATE